MVKIQIDLDEKQNKIVEIYKAMNGFVTKEEAIKSLIRKKGDILCNKKEGLEGSSKD